MLHYGISLPQREICTSISKVLECYISKTNGLKSDTRLIRRPTAQTPAYGKGTDLPIVGPDAIANLYFCVCGKPTSLTIGRPASPGKDIPRKKSLRSLMACDGSELNLAETANRATFWGRPNNRYSA